MYSINKYFLICRMFYIFLKRNMYPSGMKVYVVMPIFCALLISFYNQMSTLQRQSEQYRGCTAHMYYKFLKSLCAFYIPCCCAMYSITVQCTMHLMQYVLFSKNAYYMLCTIYDALCMLLMYNVLCTMGYDLNVYYVLCLRYQHMCRLHTGVCMQRDI